jgi:hypothetical protein
VDDGVGPGKVVDHPLSPSVSHFHHDSGQWRGIQKKPVSRSSMAQWLEVRRGKTSKSDHRFPAGHLGDLSSDMASVQWMPVILIVVVEIKHHEKQRPVCLQRLLGAWI